MNTKRNVYLTIIPREEALQRIKTALPTSLLQEEYIPSQDAVGRVLTQAIFAKASSPTFHSAAMDGVAVQAEKTYLAREGMPVYLKENIDFCYINTGNPLPEEYNAVIMIEHIEQIDASTISIESAVYPWQHVRKIGEDIIASEIVFTQYHRITPYDIGFLLTAGIWFVPVYEKVKICIIPTGNEVIPITEQRLPAPGEVLESNSHTLSALLHVYTDAITILPPISDTPEAIQSSLTKAIQEEYHCVLLCAGSSAGSKDFSKISIEHVGTVLFHGIQVMPGKPSMVGIAEKTILVGVPGYPGSAVVCCEHIIIPIIQQLLHIHTPPQEECIMGHVLNAVPSRVGMEEFIRVRIGNVNGKYIAIPLPKAAGSTSSIAKAQGSICISAQQEGIHPSEQIRISLRVPKQSVDATLLCIGSHDTSLDALNSLLGTRSEYSLTTLHTGSMGGIQALCNGTTHCAGMHLFDNKTQSFTIPYLQKYLPNEEFIICTLAMRQQGLIVPKNNPLAITSIEDLTKNSIRFCNRQRGSGTRILLDHLLQKCTIDSSVITGYGMEEYTHLSAALHVAVGTADCTLGIRSAAVALDLDFIPIIEEQYDIVIPKAFSTTPGIQALLATIQSTEYATMLTNMGGYNTKNTGNVQYI